MASLNNICYQQIKDTFYFGIFGEFQLVVDKSTGCFNATKLCNLGGKKFKEWTRLDRSKRLVLYIESCGGNSLRNFYEVRESNNDKVTKQITGQYVQKELILDIASWISPEFYFKCNEIVMNYFVSEYKNMSSDDRDEKIKQLELKMKDLEIEKDEIIQEKVDKIDELVEITKRMEEQNKRLEETRKEDRATMARQELMLQKLGITLDDMAQQNDELIDRNDILVEKIETVQKKLNIAVEDRAPQPEQTGKRERFILLKRNDEDYPYYTIRAQHSSALTALRKQRHVYETVDILLDLNCHPNSKTLYVRIKNELKQQGVVFKLCKISIENSEVDEEKLINVMKGVNEEKRNV
jgi:hypothetical protein